MLLIFSFGNSRYEGVDRGLAPPPVPCFHPSLLHFVGARAKKCALKYFPFLPTVLSSHRTICSFPTPEHSPPLPTPNYQLRLNLSTHSNSLHIHWCTHKADEGTNGCLHPNMAACETCCKFLSYNIPEILISCLI